MNKIILALVFSYPTFLFAQNEDKKVIDKKSISGQYGYDITSERGEFKGLLTLKYLGNTKLYFKIVIDESRGQYGEIEGVTKLNDFGYAIFKSSECDTL